MRHEFLLLGSGTSTGVPLAGCACAVCESTNPRNFRNRTSGLIAFASGDSLLIDAGPDLRHQCLAHKVRRVDSVLYTHSHADHILGTDDLRAFNFTHKNRITCYGTTDTFQGIKTAFPYIFSPNERYLGGLVAQLDMVEIPSEGDISVHGVLFKHFPLPHGDVTVTGFRVGELGYATDCKGLSSQAREVLRGVKILFLDGLRWESHNTHNSIHEAIEIAMSLGAETTYLIHTTHTIEYDEVSRKLPDGIKLGYDGLRVQFEDYSAAR
jgi:phosphoribosyl 1,2-cyclic phosphate phosphodiesterase